MKKLTTSIYTFRKLIDNNFLYVDKTEYIWKLVDSSPAMYFMARPRRFGKSLALSTLEAVFSGRKELFKGLAIYDKVYDWKTYPVIHLDMGNCNADTPETLEAFISDKLEDLAQSSGVILQGESNSMRFQSLIKALSMQGQVVILVDEYDKPILNNISNPAAREILSVLKGFYSTIKTCESFEHFVFVTGVSKFCHVSLFSDLNNLMDISMNADYANMLGYTQTELEHHFADRIDSLTKELSMPRAEFISGVKSWYNGYRFHAVAETAYNPVSLASFFINNGEFKNYWFSTGTPSFLVQLIRQHDFDLERALTQPVSDLAFEAFEIDRVNPLPLLLQTGYLTIHSANVRYDSMRYQLGFPNREVKEAFEEYLISCYTALPRDEVKNISFDLIDAVKDRDISRFMSILGTFFAQVPYDLSLNSESNFQLLFYSIFLLLGVRIEAESRTNNGRIDAVISDGDYVFVFEFKLGQAAEAALAQIRDKEYFRKYQNSGKTIILIGANFDLQSRQLNDWKHEQVNA